MQVNQGVHLDGAFAFAKPRPGKQGQAKIDGGGVQRIGRLLQIDAKWIVRIQAAGTTDQDLREVSKDAPVVLLIGIGQCRA